MLTTKQPSLLEIYRTEHNELRNTIQVKTLVGTDPKDFLVEYADRYILTNDPNSQTWKYLLEEHSISFLNYLENDAKYNKTTYIAYKNSLKFYLAALFINKDHLEFPLSFIYEATTEAVRNDLEIDRFYYEHKFISNRSAVLYKRNLEVLVATFPDILTRSVILETIGKHISKKTFDTCVENYNAFVEKATQILNPLPVLEKKPMFPDSDDYLLKAMKHLQDFEDPAEVEVVKPKPKASNKSKAPEILQPQLPKTEVTLMSTPQPLTTEVTNMSKIEKTLNVTVDVHKESIQNAATIEAGNIALTFLTERLKDVLPAQAQLFLYLPGAELVIATVATIGIHTFAPDNPKAMIAAKAMTTAAYGKLFARINVSKLIEDVIDKIPASTLLNILPNKE